MVSNKKARSERRFQILLAVAAAALGFLASHLLQAHEQSSRKQALVRLTSSSIRNDLSYSVLLTEGLRDNMLKGKFMADAPLFRQLYHPTVVLPEAADFGLFKPPVIDAFDEYRRHLTDCETKRQECIRALEESDSKNRELTLLTYLISLDSVILTGTYLAQELKSQYPESAGVDAQTVSYAPLQKFIGELQKTTNEAISQRLNKQVSN